MTFVRVLLAVCLFQVTGCFGADTTTTLVPTPTSTLSSVNKAVQNETVQNETVAKLNTTEKNNINVTEKSILNTTANTILNTTSKTILNTTAKSVLNETDKSNSTVRSVLNATDKSNTSKIILNATDRINLNLTKKLNLTAVAPSPKLDEIVKKIDTSVDEIKKTTLKSWLMIRGIIFVVSLYGAYKIYTIIQEMCQKKRERDEDERFRLPGTPSASSPKNSLKRSSSSGFFSAQEQTIRSKSPDNPNLRQRFSVQTNNKWHV